MFSASCHCGAIRLQVSFAPGHVISCNCSICRRYGALWAQYEPTAIVLVASVDDLVEYVWGERTIRTQRCRHCGCVTHWEPIGADAGQVVGINMRNFDPDLIRDIPVRRFDGAESWTYLDA